MKVIIEKVESPACSIGSAILNGADIAGTFASVGTTAVFIAAAIPSIAVAPVVLTGAAATGAAVGLYSVGRSAHTLIDRSNHDQVSHILIICIFLYVKAKNLLLLAGFNRYAKRCAGTSRPAVRFLHFFIFVKVC